MKKISLFLFIFVLLNTGLSAQSYSDYRFSYEEMQDIANPNKLSWRIFYRPSQGKDAQWFDAVKKGNLAEVKRMVEAGQDIEAKDEAMLGQTALGWSAFIGYEDIVRYLVEKGANLEATDRGDVYNVFKSAVLGKNVQVVKFLYPLFEGKIDLNAQEDDGETLLMVASSNNRLEIVEYLISLGADVSFVSKPKQHNALTFACERGHSQMVKLLASHGAVNFKTGHSHC